MTRVSQVPFPKIKETRLNWKNPISPQTIHPITANVKRQLSSHFIFLTSIWRDLLSDYDKPVIFGYDEIQNEFNSRDYQNFPFELVTMLTQNRKGNGKQIVGTAQRFGRVDKTIRELCTHVIECRRGYFGRVTKLRKYDVDDYEQFLHEVDVMKKRKIPHSNYKFIQTDDLRNAYDSFQMLASAKGKQYVTSAEKYGLKAMQGMES